MKLTIILRGKADIYYNITFEYGKIHLYTLHQLNRK